MHDELVMTGPQTALDETREILESLRDDPAGFQEIVLGRTLWSKQVAICEALARSPITVVPAGRAVGKSFLLAGLVLWWLFTRRPSRVITTGPDYRQVVSVLWAELRTALQPRYDADGVQVSPRLLLDYEHLSEGYGSTQRLTVEAGLRWEALGFACKTEEGLSGQHHPELLVIVDEASGVNPQVWSAIHGLAARRLLVVGNPIKYHSHFRELHDLAVQGSTRITSIAIASTEHPDAVLDVSPIGAVSKSWLDQQEELWGRNSPWWRSNVEAKFPGKETEQLFPRAWLDACTLEEVLQDDLWIDYPEGLPVIAVDVGGGVGADRSVVLVRNRKRLLEVFASEWHGVLDDARHRLEPIVVALARKWNVPGERVVYDKGGPGRSFGSYLASHGLPDAMGYFGAGKGGKLYVNRRTACAFAIHKRLDPNRENHIPFYCGGIPEWPALRQELGELRKPTMEQEEGEVKQVLEEKAELAARLHRSPDLLDSLLMSFTFLD